ncbi:hypothetical protein [Cohnella soli]|uniref:NAD(P)-binding domain-containing protein n=1 Tax=Cohnella soli TaxID=425005 RepID=A0ABW0I1C6_9BACL
MKKAMVVRTGKGIGKALIERLIGNGIDVVAYSGSLRKLEKLEEVFPGSPHLRTALGDVRDPNVLLSAAEGVEVIFCCVYTTYDEKPDKVRRMLEAVQSVSEQIGAKVVIMEGVYRPTGENEHALHVKEWYIRLAVPEIYGAGVTDTLLHHSLKEITKGKTVKLIAKPSVKRRFLYAPDAAQAAVELASQLDSYGKPWLIQGGPAISTEELLTIAGSAANMPVRIEKVAGLKLRMLQWYEPRVRKLLDRYDQGCGDIRESGLAYAGSFAVTACEEGIAATIQEMGENSPRP